MSIKPEAKRALELLALDLSKEWGRRVTLSEALIQVTAAVYANETDMPDPRNAPDLVDRMGLDRTGPITPLSGAPFEQQMGR